MNSIEAALKKNNGKISDLSSGLQGEILELKETIRKYNAAVDELNASDEPDANAEAELEATEKYLDENEAAIAIKIEAEFAEKENQDRKKQEEEAAAAQTAQEQKKGDGSGLWWLIGGIAAAVGLGFLVKKKGM